MKKIAIVLVAAMMMAGCEKLTFSEYYDCEKTLKSRTKELQAQYDAHKITATDYQYQLKLAQSAYDQCLTDHGGK